ncbi:unnamed protein product [Brachionus calyciflorus]|uniref:ISXO2-like transposase domain-containing protein n=1 Tax=Brachionus calyciflorus TaxID=104777 RepID=A0A814NF34_9BILA|nr:unnamed protein product [Brachionus calyciflorus]
MNELIILLSCGFETEYKNLNNKPDEISPVFKNHIIDVKECFEMTRNKFTIKQRELELKMNDFDILRKDLFSKKDVFKLEIKENSDSVINQIDVKKTSNIESNLDKNYKKLNNSKFLKHHKTQNGHQKIGKLIGHVNHVTCFESLNQDKILTGSEDTAIKLWDKKTSKCLMTFDEHKEGIFSLESFDNKIAIGFENGSIKIFDNENDWIIKTLKGHILLVFCLKLIDRNTLASISRDESVKIWNLDSGNCLETIRAHYTKLVSLALKAKGELFIGFKDHIKFFSLKQEMIETWKKKRPRVWVFGLLQRKDSSTNGSCHLQVVPNRDAETLLSIIYDKCLSGSIIYSEFWSSYNKISQLRNYQHQTVNHSYNFIDPDSGACTNRIESLWNSSKYLIVKFYNQGTKQEDFEKKCSEVIGDVNEDVKTHFVETEYDEEDLEQDEDTNSVTESIDSALPRQKQKYG